MKTGSSKIGVKHYKTLIVLLAGLAVLSAILSCQKPSSEPSDSGSTPMEKVPSAINATSLFSTYCASCHGLQGQRAVGSGGVLNSSILDTLGQARIKEIISRGRGNMPSFENKLSPEEIDALVIFLKP